MCCGCENEEVCESVVDLKMKRYVSVLWRWKGRGM